MVKTPSKKRRTQQSAPDTGDIFAHFDAHARGMGGGYDRQETSEQTQQTQQPDMAALVARLDALDTANRTLHDTNQRLIAQLGTQSAPAPAAQGTTVDPSKVKLDLSGLPDPMDKPAEFQAQLAERINGVVEARTYAVTQQVNDRQTQQANSNRLWTEFSEKYGEWAPHEELVGAVAMKVVERAAAKGMDTNKYMFQNSDLFLADVAKELNDRYPMLVASDEDDEEEDEGDESVGFDDTGRTVGIFGGMETGGKPAGKKASPPAGDMIKDITDLQRKSGFF